MKFSTKGRYSLRLLLDLAERRDQGYIPLKDIAERQGVSKKYLEHIVTLLNSSDLLRTNRGHRGGYMLAKEPSHYTVGQILRITEGGIFPVACMENTPNQCERSGSCKTLPVWQGLAGVMSEYLDGITLQSILDDCKPAGADEYYI
ncbi:MAG: Rrf2 family transcriptional regulator [Oscillospiraceae bacterium]|nr:Rrf2 family transcriptional regulator [Oscillospiraceae bacterium]